MTSEPGIETSPTTAGAGSAPWSDREALGEWLADLLDGELAYRRRKDLDDAPLRWYYRAMLDGRGHLLPIAAQGYARRLWPLLETLAHADHPLRILDAGSGTGTESYLMALMGHEVTGVELVEERAAAARSRRAYFETLAGTVLPLCFETANVLRHLEARPQYDVIWVMEAISHIFPPERFFALARDALGTHGMLILSDPNSRNPVALWRSIALRGSLRRRPHSHFRDPETGLPVEYAEEHIASPRTMSRALRRCGFTVLRVEMSGFMATTLLPRRLLAARGAQRLLGRFASLAPRLPALRGLGSVYTIVASPSPARR